MKHLLLAGVILSATSSPAFAQINCVGYIVEVGDDDVDLVSSCQDDTITVVDQQRLIGSSAESVDILSEPDTQLIVHPAEALNRSAGVNIHRGSGQEHLTAIRSPVLTGGAGAGSFLFLENGIPTRAAGFGNVNSLFESATEFADQVRARISKCCHACAGVGNRYHAHW